MMNIVWWLYIKVNIDYVTVLQWSLNKSTFELLIWFDWCRLLVGNSLLEGPNSFHFPSPPPAVAQIIEICLKGIFISKGAGCEEMKLKEEEKESFEGGFRWKRTDRDTFHGCSKAKKRDTKTHKKYTIQENTKKVQKTQKNTETKSKTNTD